MQAIVLYDLDLHNTEIYYRSWQDIEFAQAANIHLKWLHKADDNSLEDRPWYREKIIYD